MKENSINIKVFDSIPFSAPPDKIYSRLGYVKGVTKISKGQDGLIKKYIGQARELIRLKGAAVRVPIEKVDSGEITLSGRISFRSKALAKFLVNCKEVLIMAATAGEEVVKAIDKNFQGKDMTLAVVFDAVASQEVDQSLAWIMNCFNISLAAEGKCLTPRRFSAGYGDFSLDNQKIIYDTLRLKRLGISLTGEYILVPEKSVTAIAGIKQDKRV
ncbi:MAG: methionine synthase [Candidatus Omnitrophota bacterium]